jgi:magnesium chelatase family protein
MTARTYTVAFEGVEARLVEVQCAVSAGAPAFSLVGLPDKAVSEARERVRAALQALSIALPAKRITVNLSPADLPKEGSHFDLPIAVALLAALDIIPHDAVESVVSLGELSLDGRLIPVAGALPAAMAAAWKTAPFSAPRPAGPRRPGSAPPRSLAPPRLAEVLHHYTGRAPIAPAEAGEVTRTASPRDFREVKGQERAKRALEIAAAGRHHLFMVGTPGSGKSMLAARLPGILPPLSAPEALETSMIHSLAGLLTEGGISRDRPFREPHHTASWPPSSAGAGGPNRARSASPTTASSSWTSSPNFPAPSSTPCASRSRPAPSWSPAPMPISAIPAGSC